jgi:hypothetical protein
MLPPSSGSRITQAGIDFKKTYDLVMREALYSILIEFGVCMKLVRLIKMCFKETYNEVHRVIPCEVIQTGRSTI